MSTTQSAVDARQVGGTHYKTGYGHWDFAAEYYGPGYFKGQVTKYVVRWRKKNGVQDLEKAHHFLDKLLTLDWSELNWHLWGTYPMRLPQLVEENGLGRMEADVIEAVSLARDDAGLQRAMKALLVLLDAAREEQESGPQAHGYVDQG